jgi:2-methylcitrate dehydratase PrpD
MAGLTETLARFIAATRIEDIPAAAMEKSARILTDTLGVALAGTATDAADALYRHFALADRRGAIPIIGGYTTASRETAAMVNATLGAALDFDDVLSSMSAHPSAIILGALLAHGADAPITGKQLIAAHVVAIEVGARIGQAIGLGHYDRGFHATGTLGIFCGLAALAHLLGLDVAVTRTAFGIAGSMASGLSRNFGTLAKPLHSGLAARNAVAAIALARAGFGAAPDILEARAGFFAAFGTEASRPDSEAIAPGRAWAIVDPGVSLRKFACYNANQRPMQGVLDLKRKMPFAPGELRRLECRMPPGGMQGAIYPAPATGLQAKFSLQYALAAGVLDGRYSLWTFSDEAVARPAIQALLARIRAHEIERCAGDDPHFASKSAGTRGFVEIEIELRDGRHASTRVDVAPGHPRAGLSWDEIEEKFMDCASHGGIGEGRVRHALLQLRGLPACPDIRAILDGLVGAAVNASPAGSRSES